MAMKAAPIRKAARGRTALSDQHKAAQAEGRGGTRAERCAATSRPFSSTVPSGDGIARGRRSSVGSKRAGASKPDRIPGLDLGDGLEHHAGAVPDHSVDDPLAVAVLQGVGATDLDRAVGRSASR